MTAYHENSICQLWRLRQLHRINAINQTPIDLCQNTWVVHGYSVAERWLVIDHSHGQGNALESDN